VLQEAMKRLLKQKSHPYDVYNKIYQATKSFCVYFQPNSTRKPLKQSQNIGWNYYIARSKLHPANWTHLSYKLVTMRMLAKTQVN